ncbi:hypothetical protein Tco_0252718 [Tanacetum coccineum]
MDTTAPLVGLIRNYEEINLLGDGIEKPEFGEWSWMSPEVVECVIEANIKIIVPITNRLKVEYWDDVEDLIKDDEIVKDMEQQLDKLTGRDKEKQTAGDFKKLVYKEVIDAFCRLLCIPDKGEDNQ